MAVPPALLVVDEIGYLPITPGGGNLFFQLVNGRYEENAMILTSNRGFAEWGEISAISSSRPRYSIALAPRCRHPNRGIKLSAAPACRSRTKHFRAKTQFTPPPSKTSRATTKKQTETRRTADHRLSKAVTS